MKAPVVTAHASVQRALDFIANLFPLGPQHLSDATKGVLLTFATADIPAAADYEGRVIYVPDAAAGAQFQGSNGTAWKNLG